MIAVLQWGTLAVCGIVALARIPSALRSENRSVFGIFVLATIAMLLSINTAYTAIDPLLGSRNYTNLILRFVIYGAVLLAGYRIAKGFGARGGVRLITGPIGWAVLVLVAAATVVPFLLANTAGTSTGLSALPDQSAGNVELIKLYTVAGRFYPSFVAACLLPATIHVLRSRLPVLVRSGAAALTAGSAAMILLSLSDMLPQRLAFLQYIISSTAVLGLVVGLALIWFGKHRAARRERRVPVLAGAPAEHMDKDQQDRQGDAWGNRR